MNRAMTLLGETFLIRPRASRWRIIFAALAMVASVLAVALALPARAGVTPNGFMKLNGGDFMITKDFSNGTSDMDFIFHAAADDWSNGKTQTVIAHWGPAKNDRAVKVHFIRDGSLQLVFKDKADKVHVYSAWASQLKLQNGKGYWFRIKYNATVAGESRARFFVSKQGITTPPGRVDWGKSVKLDRGPKAWPRDTGGKWTIGAADDGATDRFKGKIAWMGFWRNGWSTNGGHQAIQLDMRTLKQASADYAKWRETGRTWNVRGSGWNYRLPTGAAAPAPTTTAAPTTTTAPVAGNAKPWAKTDYFKVPAGNTILISPSKLLANDTDPEGDSISVAWLRSPSQMGAPVTKDGSSWSYKAPSGGAGSVDKIIYAIKDSAGNVDTGEIKLTIEAAAGGGDGGGGGGGGGGADPSGFDVIIRPGDNIAAIVDGKPAGTSFYIKAGKYRLQQIRPKDGMTFVGESGAVLSGAKKLTSFSQSGGLWVASGQSQGSASRYQGEEWGYCDSGSNGMCVFPEQLFINGALQQQVKYKSQVTAGKWYFDYANDKIWFGTNPSGKTVETSVKNYAFWGNADRVTIKGLTIEKYATPGRQGAINPRIGRTGSNGTSWTVANNVIRDIHGYGIKFESGFTIAGNKITRIGQIGIGGAYASNVMIRNNDISRTCIEGYKCFGWAGGPIKLDKVTNATIRANHVHDNKTHGIHTDGKSYNIIIEDNVVVDNLGTGIHHETSGLAKIRNNVVERNGFINSGNYGILILSSSDTEVYGNKLKGNNNGILGRQDSRTHISQLKNLWVHHNRIEMSGTARVGMNVGISDTSYLTSKNNKFNYNTYVFRYGSTSFKPFKWGNSTADVSTWKSKGMGGQSTYNWN